MKVGIEQKDGSAGVYAVFESGGEVCTAHIYPMSQERTEPGSRDIYATELGYTAFDMIESLPNAVELLDQEIYSGLLAHLSNIALYSH